MKNLRWKFSRTASRYLASMADWADVKGRLGLLPSFYSAELRKLTARLAEERGAPHVPSLRTCFTAAMRRHPSPAISAPLAGPRRSGVKAGRIGQIPITARRQTDSKRDGKGNGEGENQ